MNTNTDLNGDEMLYLLSKKSHIKVLGSNELMQPNMVKTNHLCLSVSLDDQLLKLLALNDSNFSVDILNNGFWMFPYSIQNINYLSKSKIGKSLIGCNNIIF